MPTSQIERGHSRLLAIETPNALGHTSTLTIVDAVNARGDGHTLCMGKACPDKDGGKRGKQTSKLKRHGPEHSFP